MADFDGDGTDDIVTAMPRPDHIRAFWGDGERIQWPVFQTQQVADLWTSVPIADIDGDGDWDFVSGRILMDCLGRAPRTWPFSRQFVGGYQSCIGDADGDGDLEVFHAPFWGVPDGPGQKQGTLGGFDHFGNALPGWPVEYQGGGLYPVMGDVWGDEKKEIIAADSGQIQIWSLDGRAVEGAANAEAIRCENDTFFALADCTGDGKAEIFFFDQRARALRVLNGAGQPVAGQSSLVAALPELPAFFNNGIAVADLGGDGEMDVFIGAFWIRWKPGQPAKINALLDENPQIAGSPSICDLDGDSKAEILLGSVDGRVWVYQTGAELKAQWLHWATQGGNFRHTSCWENPAKIKP